MHLVMNANMTLVKYSRKPTNTYCVLRMFSIYHATDLMLFTIVPLLRRAQIGFSDTMFPCYFPESLQKKHGLGAMILMSVSMYVKQRS